MAVLNQISKVPVELVQFPNGGHYTVEHQALRGMNDSIDNFIKRNLSYVI